MLSRWFMLNVSHQGKPSLLIGHHLLEGKLVELPKPLAVMNRVPYADDYEDDADRDEHAHAPARWDIVAIVKRKMVFAKRPMPMVGLTSTTTAPSK